MSAAARKYLEKTLLEAVRKKCPHYTDSMVARVVEATIKETETTSSLYNALEKAAKDAEFYSANLDNQTKVFKYTLNQICKVLNPEKPPRWEYAYQVTHAVEKEIKRLKGEIESLNNRIKNKDFQIDALKSALETNESGQAFWQDVVRRQSAQIIEILAERDAAGRVIEEYLILLEEIKKWMSELDGKAPEDEELYQAVCSALDLKGKMEQTPKDELIAWEEKKEERKKPK